MRRSLTLPVLFCLVLFTARSAVAVWPFDGRAITTLDGSDQDSSDIVSDGAGGAIVVWRDMGSPFSDGNIYAQRVDPYGTLLWSAVSIAVLAGSQSAPAVTSDGSGGAIITWVDTRAGNADIYAQRISASGVVQWALNGVVVCAATNTQTSPQLVAAGSGNSIIAWQDARTGTYDIYAQKLDGSGVAQWTANGVALCAAANDQTEMALAEDGVGGAVAVWRDDRTFSADIYANRVTTSGAIWWTSNGTAVCTATNLQLRPKVAFDGSGVVFTWDDYRNAVGDIYAQRYNVAGGYQWVLNGVVVTNATGSQAYSNVVGDGAGGSVITWFDLRTDSAGDIYVQRLNSTAVPQWTANGVAVCAAGGAQNLPTLVPDSFGGAVIAWSDTRSGNDDVYAQRVNSSGVVQWAANGVALCTAPANQNQVQIAWDGVAGAIVSWSDYRTVYADVYTQRIHRSGYWGRPEPMLVSVTDVANDQGGKVNVNWNASQYDAFDQRLITHYSIWRSTDITAAASLVDAGALQVDRPDAIAREFRGRAVWVEQRSSAVIYWEWIANQEAHYLTSYTYASPTLSDWTLANPYEHSFFVSAHSTTQFVFFDSNTITGHSVDNLAPAAPLALTAQRVAGADVLLRWNHVTAPDLSGYSVYRATATGVTPIPMNFLSGAEDTVLVDTSAPLAPLYYIVTASDVHANQSAPSNEASVDAITGVNDTPALRALSVLPNYPNPFSTATELMIGLPARSNVSIEVFDVAGRRVRGLEVSAMPAGWNRVPFRAQRDDGAAMASGVYFYRITAAGTTLTRKLVLAR